jgi:hypothetical protein
MQRLDGMTKLPMQLRIGWVRAFQFWLNMSICGLGWLENKENQAKMTAKLLPQVQS